MTNRPLVAGDCCVVRLGPNSWGIGQVSIVYDTAEGTPKVNVIQWFGDEQSAMNAYGLQRAMDVGAAKRFQARRDVDGDRPQGSGNESRVITDCPRAHEAEAGLSQGGRNDAGTVALR